MRKKALLGGFILLCFAVNGQMMLSENAVISMLTTTPCDNEVYTLYGHTSIRVRDSIAPDKKMDIVFNYGMFDASQPFFVYHFAKGDLDYVLGYYNYDTFVTDRQLQNSSVYEQILNLTPQEMQGLWSALNVNARPENRTYRYNYFFDNCATRPANLIEQAVKGTVVYEEKSENKTFRDIINYCTRDNAWLTFGCDLVLGIQTDRVVTFRESFFIPEFLHDAFSSAHIVNPDGTKRPLVSAEYVLIEKIYDEDTSKTLIMTPLVCSLLLFTAVLFATWLEWRKKKYFRWLDCLLFFVAGIAGCIIFFLCFLSEQPCVYPNISIVWLHPLHWAGVVLFAVKKLDKAAYIYHFINFAALLLMLAAWIFIRQHLNIAFIPLIAILLLRSGFCLIRNKMNLK
jgi:hypothetical protein